MYIFSFESPRCQWQFSNKALLFWETVLEYIVCNIAALSIRGTSRPSTPEDKLFSKKPRQFTEVTIMTDVLLTAYLYRQCYTNICVWEIGNQTHENAVLKRYWGCPNMYYYYRGPKASVFRPHRRYLVRYAYNKDWMNAYAACTWYCRHQKTTHLHRRIQEYVPLDFGET